MHESVRVSDCLYIHIFVCERVSSMGSLFFCIMTSANLFKDARKSLFFVHFLYNMILYFFTFSSKLQFRFVLPFRLFYAFSL